MADFHYNLYLQHFSSDYFSNGELNSAFIKTEQIKKKKIYLYNNHK